MQIRKSSAMGWAFGLVLVVTLGSCVGDRLVGTWEVATFEMQRPGQQGVRVQNIGTITFNSDQTGEKEIQYAVLDQNFSDTLSFTWSKSEGFITLEGEGGSEFSKTWIVVDDDRTTQRWRATDGVNTVQMLELKKR